MSSVFLSPRTQESVNILFIEVKNTSCIDYILPLLWKVKRDDPRSKVSVFYAFSDRRQVLRQSSYYSDVFESLGIPEYDLLSFLKPAYARFEGLLRRFLSDSPSDAAQVSLRDALLSWRRGWKAGWAVWSDPRELARRIKHFLRRRLEARLIRSMVDVQNIMPRLDPDIIILANHTVTNFPGREYFYRYFEQERRPVILLPHAPHNIDAVADFIPFDDQGPAMTDYCDYWESFLYEAHWKEMCPDRKDQFPIIGYPGFDSEWLEWVMTHNQFGQLRVPQKGSAGDASLRCLFIIRKFLPQGFVRPPDYDPFTLDYDFFLEYLNLVGRAIADSGVDIELVVKPHPSNNYPMVKEIFEASDITRWRISHEPFYALLPEIDLVISLFSTSLLIPAMAGIPTIVLNSPLQKYVHRWDKLEQLYSGLEFFVKDQAELSHYIKQASQVVHTRKSIASGVPVPDITHMRRFFPDGAIQRGIERSKYLLDRRFRNDT